MGREHGVNVGRRRWPRRLLLTACALAAGVAVLAVTSGDGPSSPGAASTATAATQPAAAPGGTRQVLFVANNWDGTAHIVDPKTFRRLDRFNVIPDKAEREREIFANPVRLGYFLAIRTLIGENNDQFVDDMFSSPDGRYVYISRPSYADVVGIDLRTKRIVWRTPIEGQRSDHMAISPDGRRVLVSDSTANKVHVIDVSNPARGRIVDSFASGDSPHENNYSADGKKLFHASIGLVYTPADQPLVDSSKGDRFFQIHDARNFRLLKRLEIGKLLAAQGREGYSSAVRPAAFTSDDRYGFLQLSFLHGFVEFDMARDRPLRIARLPLSQKARQTPREEYLLDSAHHGLAINPANTKLCAAGTMSDYAAIVSRRNFKDYKIVRVGRKPYWSTNSGDGKLCFVSVSGDDRVSAISYATGREVARIQVGDHPQRMRIGNIRAGLLPGGAGAPPDAPTGEDGGDSTCTRKGTPGNDIIRAGPGDDVICVGGGNDVVYGGGGDDRVEAGDGNDVLYGEGGDDRLVAGRGSDVMRGADGRDSLAAHDGVSANDRLDGGAGDDNCDSDMGDERISCR